MMPVMEKHRIIDNRWEFGFCENCKGNPSPSKMVKNFLVSGDPSSKYKSTKEIWVCSKCGYSREF